MQNNAIYILSEIFVLFSNSKTQCSANLWTLLILFTMKIIRRFRKSKCKLLTTLSDLFVKRWHMQK